MPGYPLPPEPNLKEGVPPLGQDLGRRTFEGSLWILADRLYRQLLFLGSAVVLGRLLSPKDFGLVGLGALAVQFLGVLTYTGYGEALVQRPHLTEGEIHTAWWVTLGRAAAIGVILWAAAPFIAGLAHEPAATPILRALAAVQLLSGLTSVGPALLYKEMQFRQLFKLEAWGATINLLVAVVVALWWRSVWALVLGVVAGTGVRVVVSYVLYPYQPRWVFDWRAARELFRFGQWLLLTACLYFFATKGIDVLSGFIFGAVALGLYQMASRFALLPTNHLGEMFLQAMFPAYSLMQDDPQRLRRSFLKVLQVTTFMIFPLSAVIAVALGPALPLFLGPKWQGVVSLVPALAVGGAVQALLRTGPPLFLATGRPSLQFAMDAASCLGILLFIYPLSRVFGLAGLAWSYALGLSLGLPLWCRFVCRQTQARVPDLAATIAPALAGSLMLAAVIWLPNQKLYWSPLTWTAFGRLLFFAGLGALAYLLFIMLLERVLSAYQPVRDSVNLVQKWWSGRERTPEFTTPQP